MNNDGLLKIAEAIQNLTSAVNGLGFILILFLLFKNMGTSSDLLKSISDAIRRIGIGK